MQNITGKIAFGGIAIGKIKEISKENNVVRRVKIEDAKAIFCRRGKERSFHDGDSCAGYLLV